MKPNLDDLSNTLGLLVIWLAEMLYYRRFKPLGIFLYDQGYIPISGGVWEKREVTNETHP